MSERYTLIVQSIQKIEKIMKDFREEIIIASYQKDSNEYLMLSELIAKGRISLVLWEMDSRNFTDEEMQDILDEGGSKWSLEELKM